VEDSVNDVELTRLALEQNKIATMLVVAKDGAEAMKLLSAESLAAYGDLPAVILLDLNLPKVDGLEVLRLIRGDQRIRFIPIVILTSSEEDRDLIRTYELGANSYIKKPIDFAEFLAAMKHLGFYWLFLNRIAPEGA
ncbi:MAG: response regulator, partial [Thermoanaerobaculia bacterium]